MHDWTGVWGVLNAHFVLDLFFYFIVSLPILDHDTSCKEDFCFFFLRMRLFEPTKGLCGTLRYFVAQFRRHNVFFCPQTVFSIILMNNFINSQGDSETQKNSQMSFEIMI